MTTNYKAEAVAELAARIRAAGFRVFLAKSGTYGLFTDAEGSRVVCFQHDLGGFKFSGNYVAPARSGLGTGWVMDAGGTYADMLVQRAPEWATRGIAVRYTTLAQHLAIYQASSHYTELTA